MYPVRLNLISPEKKKTIARIVYMQYTKHLLDGAVLFSALTAIVLLGGQGIMQEYFNELVSTITATPKGQGEKNVIIKKLNARLSIAEMVQKTYTKWTPIIADIVGTIPKEVTLNTLSLNAETKTYHITGIATTREALLSLKKQLEGKPYAKTVDVPLSQLTIRDQVPFTLTITTK